MADNPPTWEVDATISRWEESARGPYAIAAIHFADGTRGTALLGAEVGAAPLKTPFRCRVSETQRGWRVSSLVLAPDLPERIEHGAGVVLRLPGRDQWSVEPRQESFPTLAPVVLDIAVLRQSDMADLDDGTLIRFDAEMSPTGYSVTTLHSPQRDDAFAQIGDREVADLIVFAADSWPRMRQPRAILSWAGRATPRASVCALFHIESSLLHRCGIAQVKRAEHPWVASPDIESSIGAVENALRDAATRTTTAIKCMRVRVRRNPATGWQIECILSPRANRLPHTDSEYLPWIEGRVLTVDDSNARIEFHSPEIGIGTGFWNFSRRPATAQGLMPGAPVVVALKADRDAWRIVRVHRWAVIEGREVD